MEQMTIFDFIDEPVNMKGGIMAFQKGNNINVKHGKSRTRLYKVWKSMRSRCNTVNSPTYKNYGGRGIKVCKEWDDFENFYEWAFKNGYNEKADYMQCTIDRIDNNGNYEPKNCKFSTSKEQVRNRRKTIKIFYKGRMMTIPEIAEITGFTRYVLYNRIVSLKWDVEKATTMPVKKHSNERRV